MALLHQALSGNAGRIPCVQHARLGGYILITRQPATSTTLAAPDREEIGRGADNIK